MMLKHWRISVPCTRMFGRCVRFLDSAGHEIDNEPADVESACKRALTVRHLIEQGCSDVLRRFARAYGPRPLAFDREASRRYQELDLYIRQSHAERDLESLGRRIYEGVTDSKLRGRLTSSQTS